VYDLYFDMFNNISL